MKYLRNAWYVAMWAETLDGDGPLVPRTILEEPIVFYRREDGSVAALRDVCPHRFAPLHKGKVIAGDRVRCAYHGLEFDASGACVKNPHGGRIPSACTVRSFPVVEKHTLIWVWMGDRESDPALVPDYSFLDPESGYQISRRDHVCMEANYRLVANNLLDLSHAPFLHEGILGFPETVKADITVRQDGPYVYVERFRKNITPALLADLLFRRDGKPVDVMTIMRWNAPCHLLNNNLTYPAEGSPDEGAGLLGAHILTPQTETSTLYHFAAARQGVPFDGDEQEAAEVRQQLTELRRIAFEEQDEPMIEAQQSYLLRHPDAKPVLLEIDAGPVRCNRILDDLIRAESNE